MPELYTIRGLARSMVWMRAWKTWICGTWSKIWAERALQEWGRPDQQPRCQGHCDHVARVFLLHMAEADAASFLCACEREIIQFFTWMFFVLTVLNTLSVTECAGLSLRSVKAAFWETLREWECWETPRKVSFEPDVLPKSCVLLIVKQDKHSMSMRRYTKSTDNHVIWL